MEKSLPAFLGRQAQGRKIHQAGIVPGINNESESGVEKVSE